MECHYHPGRESTDKCAICGKSICKECGLEIAGKTYCKDCLEKIVGVGLNNKAPTEHKEEVINEPVKSKEPSNYIEESEKPINKPPTLEKKPLDYDIHEQKEVNEDYYKIDTEKEDLYEIKEETKPRNDYYQPTKDTNTSEQYNIKEADFQKPPEHIYSKPGKTTSSEYNIEDLAYDDEHSLYDLEKTNSYQVTEEPKQETANYYEEKKASVKKEERYEDDFIYPDHSYQPGPTTASKSVEDKYEKYLDDLYFDEEPKISLSEQLAKDEEEYGSLTKKPYVPEEKVVAEEYPENISYKVEEKYIQSPNVEAKHIYKEEPIVSYRETEESIPKNVRKSGMTLEEEIRYNLEKEKEKAQPSKRSIHNINYHKKEKEPRTIGDIILTITLILLILIVVYYLLYLFLLSNSYPTFTDALFGLAEPGTVINHLLGK